MKKANSFCAILIPDNADNSKGKPFQSKEGKPLHASAQVLREAGRSRCEHKKALKSNVTSLPLRRVRRALIQGFRAKGRLTVALPLPFNE